VAQVAFLHLHANKDATNADSGIRLDAPGSKKSRVNKCLCYPWFFLVMTFNQRDVPRFANTKRISFRVSPLSLSNAVGLPASIRRVHEYARARASATRKKRPTSSIKLRPQDLRASKNVAYVVSAEAARAAGSQATLSLASALGNSINHLRYNRLKLDER